MWHFGALPPVVAGIPWTAAAVIAAVVAGVFILTKDVLSFVLERVKGRLDRGLANRVLYGRVAQHYFQMAVGAGKALAAFDLVSRDKTALDLVGPLPPPDVEFIEKYADPTLANEFVKLAGEAPEDVSAYYHALNVRKHTAVVAQQEAAKYGDVPIRFSYPRTRNMLRGLLQHCVGGMRTVAAHLPRKQRRNFEAAATNLAATLETFAEVTPTEVLAESHKALLACPKAGG